MEELEGGYFRKTDEKLKSPDALKKKKKKKSLTSRNRKSTQHGGHGGVWHDASLQKVGEVR